MSSNASSRRRNVQKVVAAPPKVAEKLGLHERLEEQHLVKIYNAFQAQEWKELDRKQLEQLLHDVAKITYEGNEFEVVFFRINIKRNGYATWDEFISHLILGFQEKEVSMEFQSLDEPISKLPRLMRSNHRHPINRIVFCPTVKMDGRYNYSEGSYLTCSKDGTINYWTLDFQLDRTVQSTSPELKVQATWVLDLICLPDISVVCTSSSERDLRFYDTSARKFELRIMFSSLEDAVVCMYYEFSNNPEEDSKLILGDMGGNVKILLFSSVGRGPFKSQPGIPLLHARYERLLRGLVPGFKIVEFRSLHSDWVRQVSYYKNLHCFVSCSGCNKAGMVLKDIEGSKTELTYKVPKGVWCFDKCEQAHIMVTGGGDCAVRVWTPFVPEKPSAVFMGHHAGIIGLVLQEHGKYLYSLSRDKCIKVWDVPAQTCLQTYIGLPSELGEHTDFTILYNYDNRQLIIGSVMIAVLHLRPKQSGEHTDGNTHSLGVSVILYNPLFKVVLTCGLDSFIIVWDPWTGRRMSVVREAHTRELHGEVIPVEITAACFDPGNQLLLTGAGDGTLKTWNFNTGTCLRNMSIEPGCEVSAVVWIKGRIMAIGWNRHVTEFADSGGAAGPGGAFSKSWDTRHTEDVLCAAVRIPQTLATSTYNGELVLWRLETGQPYKRYDVANPTGRIKIEYKIEREPKAVTGGSIQTSRASRSGSIFGRKMSLMSKRASTTTPPPPTTTDPMLEASASRARRISVVTIPETCIPMRGLAVHCMLFLSTRPQMPGVGTLFVAVENGTIQVWSHHASGGFITAFQAIHSAGDYVISMESDANNDYLFTGTTLGYIKTWLMEDYYPEEPVHAILPKYRLRFPFMWKDLIDGRAKRANRGQPKPTLLNSYKGHQLPISGLAYINEAEILLSCSADRSARMWTLGGRYLGTIGTFKPWIPIKSDTPPGPDHQYQLPTDLIRLASSTSFKVYVGRQYEKKLTEKQEQQQAEKTLILTDVSKGSVYGKRLEAPILGNHFKMPERTTGRHEFELDTGYAYIPVYSHLIMPPSTEFDRPNTPEVVVNSRIQKPIITQRSSRGSVKSNLTAITSLSTTKNK